MIEFGRYGVHSGPSRWEMKFSPYSMASGSIRYDSNRPDRVQWGFDSLVSSQSGCRG